MLHASCHCGAVQLEIARRPRSLTECNCNICRRYAARWAYYTSRSVTVRCAADALVAYTGRVRSFRYSHCRTCGCVTHYRRVNTSNDNRIAVNARMMEPQDLAGVRIVTLDVRSAATHAGERL